MGWDVVIGCVFVYWLMKAGPQMVSEAMAEFAYALRGEESPTAKARRERLEEVGVDPASGGAFRQYAGNAWRNFWLDKDADRRKARAERGAAEAAEESRSWWGRMQDRLDDEVTRLADRWRARQDDEPTPPGADNGGSTGDGGGAVPHVDPPAPGPTPPPRPTAGPDEPGCEQSTVHDSDECTDGPFDPPTHDPEPEPVRPPIRVTATVGDPLDRPTRATAPTEPAAITAGGTMTIVAQQEVTGVVSGANEARAIQRQIEAATAEYVAQLAKVRARIHALGEQTLGTVQMATYSQVVALTGNAAESAAAAQAAAKSCSAEVGPLMGSVARAFDRINS
ncbi:hypothetical protein [Plantactinospora sp. WMMB782]|uniref:hypothetical protein n=1 Tax=Plantactinospora sp. WMMB782 TaxID=3404121 RepID=UPI003B93631F